MQEVPEWKAKLEARRVAKEAADGQAAWRKKKGQVKGCLAAAVLAVLGFGAVASCDPRGSAKAPPASPPVVRRDEPRREVQRVPVAELLEGVKNQVAWDRKWKGRRIVVVGPLYSVNSASIGSGGHLQIGEALAWAQIRFGKEAEAAVAELEVGATVAVEGTVTAVMLGWPQLSDGRVVP